MDGGHRRTKYDWQAIEAAFVTGLSRNGNAPEFLTTTELGKHFSVPASTISERANANDDNNKTWYNKREAFLTEFKRERDTKIAEQIADQEVSFRDETLSASRTIVQHVKNQLNTGLREDSEGDTISRLSPDNLGKLANALRKAQEVGLVAMDRGKDGPTGEEEEDDWTLMRRVRAGEKI